MGSGSLRVWVWVSGGLRNSNGEDMALVRRGGTSPSDTIRHRGSPCDALS